MNLERWLIDRGVKPEEFASMIERDRTTVWRIINGRTKPDWETMKRIVAATDGAVTPNDFADGMTGATTCAAPGE